MSKTNTPVLEPKGWEKPLIVVALGGNAICQSHQKGTYESNLKNIDTAAEQIVELYRMGFRLYVTHGNGPQVGSILIQQEAVSDEVPPQPLNICGAMTQGQIGYMLQNGLQRKFRQKHIRVPVVSLITQTIVDREDPAFKNPNKPIGPFYTQEEAKSLEKNRNYQMKEVKPGGGNSWRRVVPSPEPIAIVEETVTRILLLAGNVVIGCGGGGIPVIAKGQDDFTGVEAVIDKDRAAAVVADMIQAHCLVILTDVPFACLHFGKPEQKELKGEISYSEMKKYYDEGHFLSGSMGPKVQASLRFVKKSGSKAIITSLDKLVEVFETGLSGTIIVPD